MTRLNLRGFMAVIGFSITLLASHATAAIVQIVDGKVAGARGVHIGTKLFDVDFVEGTCIAVFAGCTSDGFTFHTAEEAISASQALLDQVLLDTKYGAFDSDPTLTYGIGPGCGIQCGNVQTTFEDLGTHVATASAFNSPVEALDVARLAGFVGKTNTSLGDPNSVWAVWRARSQKVPEPSTWMLLVIALTASLLARRLARA
jgi:hypothetical protein